jgi:hypothetical protein
MVFMGSGHICLTPILCQGLGWQLTRISYSRGKMHSKKADLCQDLQNPALNLTIKLLEKQSQATCREHGIVLEEV